MRRSIPPVLAVLALAACGPEPAPVVAPPPPVVAPPVVAPLAVDDEPASAARIAADVTTLASPELGGRSTGDEGARLAADLVQTRFAELRLAPLGVGGAYLQPFQARVGAKVETPRVETRRKGAHAATTNDTPLVTADGSASGTVHGKTVFVGYGITAPAVGWDDYAGQQLDGKIAVVLDGVPTPPDPAAKKHLVKTPPTPNPLRDFGSVRYKLRTAREHHAAGVIIISASEALPPPPSDASSMGTVGVVVRQGSGEMFFPTLHLDAARTWDPQRSSQPVALPLDDVKIATRIEPLEATAWNVAGLLPARADSPKRDEVVVIGAHYDHLGHGGTSSRAPGSHEIHPGADDNASGTALLLEVARRLAALPRAPDRSVLFLAFGAEEIGAIGSRWWVEHPTVPLDHVVAMINADMVGRLREDRLIVDGVGTSAGWRPLVDAAAQGLGLDLAFGAEGFGASDHASFTAVRVPVAFFFTGVHPDYHMPSDTADKINAPGESRVATLAARLGLAVAQAPERLVFVDAPADPHGGGMRGGFKVSLGTIPDYGFAGKGVKLDGVRPDAPAARAGLARGDVIVKVGVHEVGNIHDYMFALGELEPGREVIIEVEREGKRVPLKIVPAPGR